MNTPHQIVSQLKHWNRSQPQIRKSLMDDYRALKSVSGLELRIKAEDAFRRLLDLEVYAMFLTLATKDALI